MAIDKSLENQATVTIQAAFSLAELREQGRQEALYRGAPEPEVSAIQMLIRRVKGLVDELRRTALKAILSGYQQGITEKKTDGKETVKMSRKE